VAGVPGAAIPGPALAQRNGNYQVQEMNFDLWCQEQAALPVERCDKRTAQDEATFEAYRSKVEAYEIPYLQQKSNAARLDRDILRNDRIDCTYRFGRQDQFSVKQGFCRQPKSDIDVSPRQVSRSQKPVDFDPRAAVGRRTFRRLLRHQRSIQEFQRNAVPIGGHDQHLSPPTGNKLQEPLGQQVQKFLHPPRSDPARRAPFRPSPSRPASTCAM